jgi:hypothetical protein
LERDIKQQRIHLEDFSTLIKKYDGLVVDTVAQKFLFSVVKVRVERKRTFFF